MCQPLFPCFRFKYFTLIAIICRFFTKRLIGVILIDYLLEAFYLRYLIFDIIKYWSSIDYGMGKMTIWSQIFFFRFKINYIMKYSYSAIVLSIILYYIFI